MLMESELQETVLLILANKHDMENALSVDVIAQRLGVDAIKHRKHIMSCSAKTRQGYEEAMQW
eukprot:CAMPEP_0202724332 /NCGR_PEP_ID=MMETSP1385-20130828/172786_1 /ASSEMBLY_ACC=CAM_ASM_000861 /TAXON_ID=933848 /ORGANISM="Elphidium margaritaceum" /LENGTH=62 /DNA_ID=CAMNT_0049389879 /DNA_START=1 /DNA_END=186 /DNA_ORIENTATION=-